VEEEDRGWNGWYKTSNLVQLEDDQIASRVINRSAVLSRNHNISCNDYSLFINNSLLSHK